VKRQKTQQRKTARVKHSRGAIAMVRKRQWSWPTLPRINVRVIAFVCMLGSLSGIGYFGYHALNNAAQRPIKSVAIEGEFAYVSQEEVTEMLEPIIVDGFLQLPLTSVKQKLERHPWIARVNVSRRWPDTLLVAITEQQAIARWGEVGFLNQHGEIIAVEQTPVLAALPWLDGTADSAKLLMQHYQQFAQLLRPHGLRIATIQSDGTNDMSVTLSNGVTLYLGQDEVMEKFQRFLLVLQHDLKSRIQEIATVDLRYSNGLAVQWQTPSENGAIENIVATSGVKVR